MSERLQNVLRILEGGASDRRRTQLGIGPRIEAASASIRAHRIVELGQPAPAEPMPDPVHPEPIELEPVEPEATEPEPLPSERYPFGPEPTEDDDNAGLVVVAAENPVRAIVSTRVVETRDAELPAELDPRMVLLRAPESPQAKSFRLLAHRARHTGDPRVMLVTSPRRGDGKTTCAVNLALALAEDGGARVLLIEANSRAPSHAEMFGMKQVVGLPRQLARLETALVPWTTYALAGTRLHVLPAENDGVVLGRGVFAAALADLKNVFDYVIVDSSSVLDSADLMPLVDAVDGILLCARAKKTRTRELERATKQLSPAPVLGVVLLDVKEAAKS